MGKMSELIEGKKSFKMVIWSIEQEIPKYLTWTGWISFFFLLFFYQVLGLDKTVLYLPIALFIVANWMKKKYFEAIQQFITSAILLFLWLEFGFMASFWGSLILLPILIGIYVIRTKNKKKKFKN